MLMIIFLKNWDGVLKLGMEITSSFFQYYYNKAYFITCDLINQPFFKILFYLDANKVHFTLLNGKKESILQTEK